MSCAKNPAGTTTIIEITGYDATAKNYMASGYVSDGSRDTTVQTISPGGRVWTSRKVFTVKIGKEVLLKCVLMLAPDWNSYTATEGFSVDAGKTWKLWHKFGAKRVDRDETKSIKDTDWSVSLGFTCKPLATLVFGPKRPVRPFCTSMSSVFSFGLSSEG